MFGRIIKAVVLIPVAAALVAWAVANREPVTVSFDPFDAIDPAFTLTQPLYVTGFAILIAGVVLGGVAAWLEQGKVRRARAHFAEEAAALRLELEALKRQAAAPQSRALTQPPGAIARRPPAA